jgi:hypothetical protein
MRDALSKYVRTYVHSRDVAKRLYLKFFCPKLTLEFHIFSLRNFFVKLRSLNNKYPFGGSVVDVGSSHFSILDWQEQYRPL